MREFENGGIGRAKDTLSEACDVWRDISLPDFPATPAMTGIARQLKEELHSAEDLQVDILLRLQRHAEAIPILTSRTIEHPEHERYWVQLMLALYQAGRRAQALKAFSEARNTLVETAGIEPGPAMQRVHLQILRDDPDLTAPGAR